MPTSLPRYPISETPPIAHALDLVSARWPGVTRAELLRRLIEVGGASLAHTENQAVSTRKTAIMSSSGAYAGAFGPGYLDPENVHHASATDLLLPALPDPLRVHPITLAEVLVGGARIGRERQMNADLRAMGIELADQDDQQPLRLARLRVSTRLKLPDCCALDTATTHGTLLATFDQALGATAAAQGVTVLPVR